MIIGWLYIALHVLCVLDLLSGIASDQKDKENIIEALTGILIGVLIGMLIVLAVKRESGGLLLAAMIILVSCNHTIHECR